MTSAHDVSAWSEPGVGVMRKRVGRAAAGFQISVDALGLDKTQIPLTNISVGIQKSVGLDEYVHVCAQLQQPEY